MDGELIDTPIEKRKRDIWDLIEGRKGMSPRETPYIMLCYALLYLYLIAFSLQLLSFLPLILPYTYYSIIYLYILFLSNLIIIII
jgi:hypothetical protein